MPRNVEIKARVPDLEALASRAAAVADRGPVVLKQDDAFFPAATGRLKLRQFSPASGELIHYERPDAPGPKESRYSIVPTAEPDALRAQLTAALGTLGRVRKRRRVYWIGATRIHLDEVEALGAFLELEVVLADDQSLDHGRAEADRILSLLGVPPTDLVSGAYLDLLRASEPSS